MTDAQLLSQWERGWRSHCPLCSWTSRTLPFPNPDEALHVLYLHTALEHEEQER